tara:strand:+ start:64 stop:1779 length:1716 start_codon:yes stop_codon:yes gene_type:complete
MSYRNPKIITPPNYGEIFAKNMQYGASMVQSAIQPIISALETQKKTKARMAESTSMYQQNVRNLINTKSGSFENMFEEHLQKNADAWYENEKAYANGKIDAKEYNTFRNNLNQEIYDAAEASESLNKIMTFIETNKNMLSGRNDHEIFGLKEAIEDPNEFNLQLTRNEEGKSVLKYTAQDGNTVEFDYSKLRSARAEDIILRNNYAVDGDMGKKLKNLGILAMQNANDMIETTTSKPIVNKKAGTQTVKTFAQISDANKLNLVNNGISALASGQIVFTDKEIESHYLDEMHGGLGEYETRVAQTAAVMAKKYGIENVEELTEKLKTPFKSNVTIKTIKGEDVSVSKIALDAAEQDLIMRGIKSTTAGNRFFSGTGRIQTGQKTAPLKVSTPSNKEIDIINSKLEAISTLYGGLQNGLNSNLTVNETLDPKDVSLSGIYNVNIKTQDNVQALQTYMEDNLGMRIERITDKKADDFGAFALYGSKENPLYYANVEKEILGVPIAKGAKTEMKISENTSLFDILSFRLQVEDIKVSAEELKDIYEKTANDPVKFTSLISELFGISKYAQFEEKE